MDISTDQLFARK